MKGLLIHIADIFPFGVHGHCNIQSVYFILWRNTEFSAIDLSCRGCKIQCSKIV